MVLAREALDLFLFGEESLELGIGFLDEGCRCLFDLVLATLVRAATATTGADHPALRADIDYGFREAKTTYGRIGVKVWIYKGDITNKELAREQAAQKPSRDRNDRPRRDRAPKAEPVTAGVEA